MQRPVFLVNSRLSHFSAALSRSGGKPLHRQEHPFFRSYGANWSSSLRMGHPSALEYSSRPPVSVSGTDTGHLARGFSWQCGIKEFCHPVGSIPRTPQPVCNPDFPGLRPTRPDCYPVCSSRILLRHPMVINGTVVQESLCLLSIAYAFRPRLRVRLTPGGVTWPGNPWTFGGRDSRPPCRY